MTNTRTGFLVVPYAVRFDPRRGVGWFRDLWPLFWHLWSEHTDLMRHPLDRRLRELAFWWEHSSSAVPAPWLESRAVQWWLARLMGAAHWTWDRAFVAAHTGQPRGVSPARRVPVVIGETALRPPLRELLFPPPFGSFVHQEQWSELSRTSGDHIYIPPVTCYHARLTTLRHRPVWFSLPNDERSAPMTMRAIRLHQFRFGNGLLSMELGLSEPVEDSGYPSLAEQIPLLHSFVQRPRDLTVTFAARESHPPVVHGRDTVVYPLRDLVRDLLTPPRLYDQTDKPDSDQWVVQWADDPATKHAHRIELPLPDRLPLLVMDDLADGDAARIQVDGLTTTAEALPDADGVTAGVTAASPSGDRVPEAGDGKPDGDGEDDDDGSDDDAIDPGDRRRLPVTPIDTHRWTALCAFLLAVFRHVKTVEIADAVTSGRGNLLRSSARQLQALSVQLGHARDRFLGLAPVFGGWIARLWDRLDTTWGTTDLQDRVGRVVDSYRDGFFRGQSLRLVARVTSTFWFLFRWILLPLVFVQLVVIFGAAALFGVAGLLILSLATTVVILVARLVLWLDDEEETPPEPPPIDADASADDVGTEIIRSRSNRWWGYLRRGLQLLAWSAPLVALVVVMAVWPQLTQHITAYLLWFGIPLVVGLIVLALVLRLIRSERRRRALAHFRRDTFPILALVLLVVAVYAAAVGIFMWVEYVGWERFTLPGFWTDVAPDVTPDNLPGS